MRIFLYLFAILLVSCSTTSVEYRTATTSLRNDRDYNKAEEYAIKAIEDPVIMMRALKYAKAFDALIMQHPQDYNLSKNGYMNAGLLSTKLGIKGIPIEAEVIQIERDIRLTEMTKGKIHFLNVTSKESVEIIEKAQRKGINVSCSTSPHYFNLTEEDNLNEEFYLTLKRIRQNCIRLKK